MKTEIKIKQTAYPQGWVKNPTDKQFNDWAKNIYKQLNKTKL